MLCCALSAGTLHAQRLPVPAIHYDFEEIAQGSVPDRAGVMVDGQLQTSPALLKNMVNGVKWSEEILVNGKSGKGIRFGGAAAKQFLEVRLAEGINIETDDFTLAFWFSAGKPEGLLAGSTTSAPYWQFWFGKYGDVVSPCFSINAGAGHPTTLGVFKDAQFVADGQWHHYALVVDRGRAARLYVDGEIRGNVEIRAHRGPLKHVLTIGGPYNHLEGVMDEFLLFQGSCGREWVDRMGKQ